MTGCPVRRQVGEFERVSAAGVLCSPLQPSAAVLARQKLAAQYRWRPGERNGSHGTQHQAALSGQLRRVEQRED